jgi:hypothetical protein
MSRYTAAEYAEMLILYAYYMQYVFHDVCHNVLLRLVDLVGPWCHDK